MNLLRKVTLDRANRRKDKSVTLTFTTQLEESSEGFMEVDKLLGSSGVLYFKDSGVLTTEEVKELDNVEIEVEGKTKSQRLRNVLYVYHQQTNPDLNFPDFYSQKMEEIIEHYKSKLTEDK
jgi:hypothetical protein